MYALEPEPEKRGRYQRFGIGGAVALGIGAAFIFGAQHIAPAQRLLSKVMPFSVVDEQPPRPKKEPDPEPPPVDLPKPKPKPQQAPTAAQPAVPPPPSAEPPKPAEPPGPETVGLDSDSFGSGSGGPAFHAGSTQMGVPTGGKGGGGGGTGEAEAPKVAPKVVEARAKPNNRQPAYPEKARRMAIEGLIVIEADIDPQGKVTRAVVRQKLEPSLDEEARKTVLGWSFEPATLLGKPVASTKFLRIRFQLE